MRTASVSMSPIPSEMGDTHVHFIRPEAPTPRSEYSEVQNLCRNAAEGLPQKSS